jgi:hypothetical protein
MDKTLKLALNKYAVVPHTLRDDPKKNQAAPSVKVGLANLYHHYYLDSFGRVPPNPDPVQFEHTHFLLPCQDFRFQGSGLGVSPAIRRHRSNELGQAFCRWFLYEHFNITYFAHVESVLNRQLHRAFEGFKLQRSSSGDTPDYFCAESATHVYLAEAKGRYSAIGFKNKEFSIWRSQFQRVVFLDAAGIPRSIKGHIVATRFATEESGSRLQSGIWAEDPESPGEPQTEGDGTTELGSAVVSAHYSTIAVKLSQPLLASALATGVPLPEEVRILGVAWRVLAGPLAGRRFVGGYFGLDNGAPIARKVNEGIVFDRPDPLRLDRPNATFFGLEESIFRQVVGLARSGPRFATQLSFFEQTDFFYSGFSVLRDGSALGPLDFFAPEEGLTL